MVKDNDYAYIEVFIQFLERIINIIKGLFGGATKEEETTKAE